MLVPCISAVWLFVAIATTAVADVAGDAQAKLQASFGNLRVTDFRESPIEGIYQLTTGTRVIYYHPAQEFLIFGEIYNKDGRSLTRDYLDAHSRERIAELPLEQAIRIGTGRHRVIEFTDPDCPYCRKLDAFLDEQDVTRYLFFAPQTARHPDARRKAIHVLCSEAPDAALSDLYGDTTAPHALVDCARGTERLQRHEKVSAAFGVSATPTLVLKNSVITGFVPGRIAQLLQP